MRTFSSFLSLRSAECLTFSLHAFSWGIFKFLRIGPPEVQTCNYCVSDVSFFFFWCCCFYHIFIDRKKPEPRCVFCLSFSWLLLESLSLSLNWPNEVYWPSTVVDVLASSRNVFACMLTSLPFCPTGLLVSTERTSCQRNHELFQYEVSRNRINQFISKTLSAEFSFSIRIRQWTMHQAISLWNKLFLFVCLFLLSVAKHMKRVLQSSGIRNRPLVLNCFCIQNNSRKRPCCYSEKSFSCAFSIC
mgnify:CR=1 FL=1